MKNIYKIIGVMLVVLTIAASQLVANSDDTIQTIKDIINEPANNQTALHYSTRHGSKSVEIIKLLIELGASLEIEDSNGRTPLFYAVIADNIEAVEALLDAGAEVDHLDKGGRTPFFCASLLGNNKIGEVLLNHGADINTVDKTGRTALDWAIEALTDSEWEKLGNDSEIPAETREDLLKLRKTEEL